MLYGRFKHVSEAVQGLVTHMHSYNPTSRLIRVEGIDQAGKSTLAHELAKEMPGARLFKSDCFRHSPPDWNTFTQTVRIQAFQDSVVQALEAGQWAIADSVCLDDLLPEVIFGRGFRIYVMRLTPEFHGLWRWDYGDVLTRDPIGYTAIDLSVREYHQRFRPHERADAVIQIASGKA
jgi:hypothetical protein